MYAQDEWRVGSRLTLNGGVRYDLQFLDGVNTDTNNVSPRAGFVWAPTASATFLIRGGAGSSSIGFRYAPWRMHSCQPGTRLTPHSSTNRRCRASCRRRQVHRLSQYPAGPFAVHCARIVYNDGQGPAECGLETGEHRIERTLGGSRTMSVGYQYFRGENLLMSINQNVPTCAAAGTNNGCRPVSTSMNNSQYRGAGDSNYHGLHVTYLQRPKNWSAVRVSYALSKAMNDLGEAFFSSPTDPTNVMKDWGRSDNDQRHRLVISGSVNSPMTPGRPRGSESAMGSRPARCCSYYSSLPSTSCQASTACRYARTSIGGWIGIDAELRRPPGGVHPEECGRGNYFFIMSLRVSRSFRLAGDDPNRGLDRAFNLTDRVNRSRATPPSALARIRRIQCRCSTR